MPPRRIPAPWNHNKHPQKSGCGAGTGAMPEPLSEAAARRVEELLREGLSAVEVSRRCIGRWPLVTPARVRMEAYRLGIGLHLGRRLGSRMPGVGGRPRGATSSPYRDRARELREQGHSLRGIAEIIGSENGRTITAEAIRKLLISDGSKTNSQT